MKPISVLLVTVGDNIPLPDLSIKGKLAPAVRNQTADGTYIGAEFGEPPYTFAVTAGAEPAGTALGTDGVLTGTYTTQGFYEFTVQCTDNNAGVSEAVFAITVGGGIVVSPALPYCETGIAYSANLVATGGTPPYVWTLQAGSLPSGLAIVGATLTGTRASVSFPTLDVFTLRCTDATGNYADTVFKLAVWRPINMSVPDNVFCWENVYFSKRYAANWGIVAGSPLEKYPLPKVTWSINTGGFGFLPPGLALDPVQGIIAGVPSPSSPGNFFLEAVDEMGGTLSEFQQYVVQTTKMPILYSYTFGNGIDTNFVIPSPYFDNFVPVVVIDATGEEVECKITHDKSTPSSPQIIIDTYKVPATDEYRIILVGQ